MPTAPTRAPCSISTRRSSKAPPPSRRRRPSPRARDRSRCAPRSEISVESKLSSEQGGRCWPCWGSTARSRPGEVRRNSRDRRRGVWHAPLRLKAKLSGAGLDAEAQGTAEPWAQDAEGQRQSHDSPCRSRAAVRSQAVRCAGANISLSSRVTLAGSKLTFDDLDGVDRGFAAARAHRADARR